MYRLFLTVIFALLLLLGCNVFKTAVYDCVVEVSNSDGTLTLHTYTAVQVDVILYFSNSITSTQVNIYRRLNMLEYIICYNKVNVKLTNRRLLSDDELDSLNNIE